MSPRCRVVQVLAAAYQALKTRRLAGDVRAEKALVALLTLPITKYDVVTGLGLSEWYAHTHVHTHNANTHLVCSAARSLHFVPGMPSDIPASLLALWPALVHPAHVCPSWWPAAEYPLLMGLLRQRTHKELATRIVHTVLDTSTKITSLDKSAMLFRWAGPGGGHSSTPGLFHLL